MSNNCPKCGHANRPDARFCGGCGQPLALATAPPVAAPPAPAPPPSPPPAAPPALTPLLVAPPASAAKPASSNRKLLVGVGLALYLLAALGVTALGRSVEAKMPVPPATAPVALPVMPREAGQKGLDWLLDNAVAWQRDNRCYGCHVQSFAVMGAAVAQANAYDVNLAQARELADYLASIQAGEGYITAGQGQTFRPVIQTALAGIGLSQYDLSIGMEYASTLVKMADWLVAQQTGEGYWIVDHEEAPVDQGEAMVTGGALMTLAAAKKHQAQPAYDQAIGRGATWLRTVNPATTQDIVFVIIGLRAAGAAGDDPDVARFVEMLKSQQNADGGWGETAALGSNGYATGQALYAYKVAGVSVREESFRRGVLWLLDHQQGDGSWRQVNSQQRDRNRSSNFATTMWAAIGLGEIFSPEVEREFMTLIHPARSRLGLGALVVFFLIPALVVLPVWWHRQGRRWLAYRRERRGGKER